MMGRGVTDDRRINKIKQNKTKQNIAFELLLVFLILSHRKQNEKYLSSIMIYCCTIAAIYTIQYHHTTIIIIIEGGQSIWNWLPFILQKCMTRYEYYYCCSCFVVFFIIFIFFSLVGWLVAWAWVVRTYMSSLYKFYYFHLKTWTNAIFCVFFYIFIECIRSTAMA